MVEVFACNFCGGFVADGQPDLRAVAFFQIVRGFRSAHLRGDPAGFEGIGENIGPMAGHCEGQQHVVKFRFSVRFRCLPLALFPEHVFEARVYVPVQP